jgi:adenylate kinase family enzyme
MKIFLLGFMGAGKSYWGKQLAIHWDLPYFDLDDVIVEREGMAVAEIFAEKAKTISECWKAACFASWRWTTMLSSSPAAGERPASTIRWTL